MFKRLFILTLSVSITIIAALSFAEENLATNVLLFKYRDVSSIKGEFEKLISDKGKIEIFPENYCIKITDIPSKLEIMKKMAEELDKPAKQYMVRIRWLCATPKNLQQPWGISELKSLSSINGMLQDKELMELLNNDTKNTNFKLLRSPAILTLANTETKFNIKSEAEKFDVSILPKAEQAGIIRVDVKLDLKENYFRSLGTNLLLELKDKKTAVERTGGFNNKGKVVDRLGQERSVGEEGEYIIVVTIFAVGN